MSLLNQALPGTNKGDLGTPPVGGLSQGYVFPGGNLSQGYGASLGALNQDMMTGAAPMVSTGYIPVMAAGPQMGNHYQQVSLHHHSQQQLQQQQQQLVFPSALPPSYPSSFSTMGMPSTFTTYDGKEGGG